MSLPEPMCMWRPVMVRLCFGAGDAIGDLLVPDAVLRVAAAGVGLLAVAVAEAGIDAQRDAGVTRGRGRPAGEGSPYWSIMSGEPQLTCMSCSHDHLERLAVEDVGGEDDLGRMRRWPGLYPAASAR